MKSIDKRPLDFQLILFEKDESKIMPSYKQAGDIDIIANSGFTTSAIALTVITEARGLLYFTRMSFSYLTRDIYVPLVIQHLEYGIQAKEISIT